MNNPAPAILVAVFVALLCVVPFTSEAHVGTAKKKAVFPNPFTEGTTFQLSVLVRPKSKLMSITFVGSIYETSGVEQMVSYIQSPTKSPFHGMEKINLVFQFHLESTSAFSFQKTRLSRA